MDEADAAQRISDWMFDLAVRAASAEAAVLNHDATGPVVRACEDCGEPIAAERLRVAPGAWRCIECQRELENYRQRGGR